MGGTINSGLSGTSWSGLSKNTKTQSGRSGGDRRKEHALTRGGLGIDSVFYKPRTHPPAADIVVVEYELRTDTAEDSQINEGLNDRLPEIR